MQEQMHLNKILILKLHGIILFKFSLTVKWVYSVHTISISGLSINFYKIIALHFLDKSAPAVSTRFLYMAQSAISGVQLEIHAFAVRRCIDGSRGGVKVFRIPPFFDIVFQNDVKTCKESLDRSLEVRR